MSLSVCCMTVGPPGRVAAMLELLRPTADEIVVIADDRTEEDALERPARLHVLSTIPPDPVLIGVVGCARLALDARYARGGRRPDR